MKKYRNPPTIEQKWAMERCWQNRGSLAGMITRISQIASDDSTLDSEYLKLLEANYILQHLLDRWKLRYKESKSQYLFRRSL